MEKLQGMSQDREKKRERKVLCTIRTLDVSTSMTVVSAFICFPSPLMRTFEALRLSFCFEETKPWGSVAAPETLLSAVKARQSRYGLKPLHSLSGPDHLTVSLWCVCTVPNLAGSSCPDGRRDLVGPGSGTTRCSLLGSVAVEDDLAVFANDTTLDESTGGKRLDLLGSGLHSRRVVRSRSCRSTVAGVVAGCSCVGLGLLDELHGATFPTGDGLQVVSEPRVGGQMSLIKAGTPLTFGVGRGLDDVEAIDDRVVPRGVVLRCEETVGDIVLRRSDSSRDDHGALGDGALESPGRRVDSAVPVGGAVRAQARDNRGALAGVDRPTVREEVDHTAVAGREATTVVGVRRVVLLVGVLAITVASGGGCHLGRCRGRVDRLLAWVLDYPDHGDQGQRREDGESHDQAVIAVPVRLVGLRVGVLHGGFDGCRDVSLVLLPGGGSRGRVDQFGRRDGCSRVVDCRVGCCRPASSSKVHDDRYLSCVFSFFSLVRIGAPAVAVKVSPESCRSYALLWLARTSIPLIVTIFGLVARTTPRLPCRLLRDCLPFPFFVIPAMSFHLLSSLADWDSENKTLVLFTKPQSA